MIVRLAIFDFDGTLCASPEPTDENKRLWEKVNGRDWPHKGKGWWSKPESLCIKTFNPQLINHVKQDALDMVNDPLTYTVLLTGRIPAFQKTVKEILRINGMPYFDAYYFNNSHNTLDFKLATLAKLKEEFPNTTHLTMWEDREKHIPHFIEWGKTNYGDNFQINIIK